jgi:hypothetical protein
MFSTSRNRGDFRSAVLDPGWVDRRERWFVQGAAALRRTLTVIGPPDALPPTGEFYACPCCLTAYGRDALHAGVFTDEHVPPRAAGGQILVLTCGDCNHSAGSAFDAHAERREAVHDFLAGRGSDRTLRAEFRVGNVANRRDGLLAATLDAVAPVGPLPQRPVVHLDAGDDFQPCRQVLAERSMAGEIATRGKPAPVQVGGRWPVERTRAGQPVRQAALVHRAPPGGGGVLAGAGCRRDRVRPADPPRLDLLPLGQPTPPPPMTTYRRRP